MCTTSQLHAKHQTTAEEQVTEKPELTDCWNIINYIIIKKKKRIIMVRLFSTSLIVTVALLFFNCSVKKVADDPELIRINGETITMSEFIEAYEKNNMHQNVADPKTPEEYLAMYVNFRLKIKEARALGLDTARWFVEELEKYRQELSQPYLSDPQVTRELIEEAYERMQYDIRASHILIHVASHALPEDTLSAYNRVMELRERILEGEDFATLAVNHSGDPSARDRPARGDQPAAKGNEGDLGDFSAFQTIYPFETKAYNTKPGEISMPARTQYGYHLIKVTDKQPTLGQVTIAHIMINATPDDTAEKQEKAEEKINKIYQKLLEGQPFEQLASEYSEHEQTAQRGGKLSTTQPNRMLPEFVEALHNMSDTTNITEPVKTDLGWHIIKLIERIPHKPFDEIYHELEKRITRDQRFKESLRSVIYKLKEEYGFKEYPENLSLFYEIVDNSIFMKAWEIPSEDDRRIVWEESPVAGVKNIKIAHGPPLDAPLFEFAGNTIMQKDYAKFLHARQTKRTPMPIPHYVNRLYETYKYNMILEFEDQRLEEKYPEFKRVLKEYHDGILIFELTDKKVWSRSMKDTAGLKKFYNDNKVNYMGDKRIDATIYICSDEESAAKVAEMLENLKEKDDAHKSIMEKLNDGEHQKVSAERSVYEIQDKAIFEKTDLQAGISDHIIAGDNVYVFHIHELPDPQPRPMDEIRGRVIADYQDHLNEQWIKELRRKYRVRVNEKLLSEIEEHVKNRDAAE